MRGVSVLAPVMALALLAGCRSDASIPDKAGSTVDVLALASTDPLTNHGSVGPEAFVAAVTEVSGGRLRAEVDDESYAGPDTDSEVTLVRDIAEGRVDGGWPSTRAFAEAGVGGLEVVEAPFTLTSHAALAELVHSPVAGTLLERLEGSGLVGLALTVGPLRRPMGVDGALLGAETWHDLVIRSYNSPVQDATIEALGARPNRIGHAWLSEVKAGKLDGIELDVTQYYENGHSTEAGHITGNVVLWPKVFVLALSQRIWDQLSEEQRGWVQTAAERAVTASVEASYDETPVVRRLCRAGAQVHTASAADVRSLEEAVAPVLDGLASDPVFAQIREIGARHKVDALDAGSCRPAVTYETVRPGQLEVPTTPSGLPDGVYRAELSTEDVQAANLGPAKSNVSGIWTLTVSDGFYTVDCTPVRESSGVDCTHGEVLPSDFDWHPREIGTVTGDDETVYFSHDMEREQKETDCVPEHLGQYPESCLGSSTNRMTWSLEGEELTFTDLVTDEPALYYVLEPWRRIG